MKAKNLITKGFFPKEFPDLFSTKDLYKSLSISNETLEANQKTSIPIKTSIPKGGGFRRNISIPNPKHYTLLAKFLEQKSTEIDRFLKLSKISMSTTVFKENSSRAIVNKHSYEDVLNEKILKAYSSKFLLTADISKFYNTIYTHSIPWALHGKIESKNNRTDDLWGNKLDRLVRNMQDSQTLGIPIGPDSSRIISEIIGVALDKIIQENTSNLNGIRFIDDFFFFVDSYAEAETLSLEINRALNKFELTANENKSSIEKLPILSETLELQSIKNYKIRKNSSEQKIDIIHIYNIAIALYKKYPTEHVFHYFLTKIMPLKIKEENWETIESILLQIAMTETKSINIISKLLVSYQSYGYNLNINKIRSTFLKIIKYGIDNNFGYEICWAFWTLQQLKITIHQDINNIENITDPLAILTILSFKDKGYYIPNIDLKNWNNLITKNSLYDGYWILCYEGEKRNWLINQDGIKHIDNDIYFKKLNNFDISFLDTDSKITPMDINSLNDETNFEFETDMFEFIYGKEKSPKEENDENDDLDFDFGF